MRPARRALSLGGVRRAGSIRGAASKRECDVSTVAGGADSAGWLRVAGARNSNTRSIRAVNGTLSISERLDKQRTLADWLRWQLDQTTRTIRDLEAEEREEARRKDVARREQAWKVQPSRAVEGEPMLHRGGCGLYDRGGGVLSADEVLIALREFPGIEKPPPRKLPGGGSP